MPHTVLAVLMEQEGATACLDAAVLAAAVLPEGRVTALHVRLDPDSTIIPSEAVLTPKQREALALQAESEAAALHAVFAEWQAARRGTGCAAEWLDDAGRAGDVVARHGCDAALVAMAAPRPQARGPVQDALHAALFDTHRLLLLVPHPGPVPPPRRIAIGWKDCTVCRKTIAEALPWLRAAQSVEVLHVVARDAAELQAADRLLRGHGIAATLHALPRGEAPVGRQLLEVAAQCADWLLIGAFRRPQAVEWLLGGVTRIVLQEARIPVLMGH